MINLPLYVSLSIKHLSASVHDKSGYLPQRYILGVNLGIKNKLKYSVRMWNSEYFQMRKKPPFMY